MNSCWIIAGAASAIAIRFAHQVAQTGDQVILLGRDLKKLSAIQADIILRYAADVDIIFFDAEKSESHQAVADSCMQLAKHPVSLLIAFGVMLPGMSVTHSQRDAVKVIDANFTGAASITYSFLPYLQAQKQCHILVLGSVAGDRGRPANFDYGAAKSALNVFYEGLRAALYSDGVSVTVMKLGYIDTPMTYGKSGFFLAASPDACAAACLKAAMRKTPVKYFPWFWRWIMLIFKSMPRIILQRLKV
jgi:decaprenylphospho-beta-D-erythro-pentofuranosid-2-ulose 2-reductase